MSVIEGLSDTVHITRADRREVICPGLDGPSNLAWGALDALARAVGRPLELRVRIEKRIPARAGLGGGSSDAAATLVGASRLLGLGLSPAELERIGAEVGSDVPFFIRGGAQWAEGRGERLSPAAVPAAGVLVLAPSRGLSTGEVYRAFDRLPAPAAHDSRPPPVDARGLAGWVRNDLWAPALALLPALGGLARQMRAAGALATLLCGSGSAVAGLFLDAKAARSALDRVTPDARLARAFANLIDSASWAAT